MVSEVDPRSFAEALVEVNNLLSDPAVVAQLDQVKAAAGPDPMMAMMIVRVILEQKS